MEQKTPLVSVIIPIYNVEQYLNRCIDSVLNQTYINMEIILIDDGSTDRCAEICNAYAELDERIRVVHKENGGLSSARNSGLEIARGEFVGFVDGDDYIAKDMYQCMVEYMQSDVDITCCGTSWVSEKEVREENCMNMPTKFSQEQAMEEAFLLRKLSDSVCDKLFRRELFDGLSFLVGRVSEDVPMLYSLLKRARNVYHIGDSKYFYCYREDSISNRDFYLRRIDYLLFKRDICIDVRRNYPKLIGQAEAGYIRSAIGIAKRIAHSPQRIEYYYIEKRIKKMLRNNLLRGMKNSHLGCRTKMSMLITCFVVI